MAAIDELLTQIEDDNLRTRILAEVGRLRDNKQFGLVWERHLPENALLSGFRISPGATVAMHDSSTKEDKTMTVLSVDTKKGTAVCRHEVKEPDKSVTVKKSTFALDDLVAVARCGEPIFPTLRPIDKVVGAPDSALWHSLIQAENYHALQLLTYLYPGQVDCIYIDPPYNTGARDWKYNNDYVDDNDKYRHSKWLSMMESRLLLAKKLLNPANSVLIVTIDEKEYLHLGCLLEKMFPEARMQMVTNVINPKGVARKKEFSRAEEYIYFVFLGEAEVSLSNTNMLTPTIEDKQVRWASLLRSGNNSSRSARPNLFYPLFFCKETGIFKGVGQSLSLTEDKTKLNIPDGCFVVFPTKKNGEDATWCLQQATLLKKIENGYVKFGPWRKGTFFRSASYLAEGTQKALEKGEIEILGKDSEGAIITGHTLQGITPLTVWNQSSHSASDSWGSSLLLSLFKEKRFAFPKSLYAVADTLRFFVKDKPNALIVDFFAGSGTTLHAVNLLNAEDGGNRRCIMITNNEVSEEEANGFREQGLKPGDPEWEARGIAQYVTWPRTVCSIKGVDVNGKAIQGDYITTQTKEVKKGRTIKQLTFAGAGAFSTKQKKEIVSLLGKNKLPQSAVKDNSLYIASADYPIAILFDETAAEDWLDEITNLDNLEELYIFTTNTRLFNQIKNRIQEDLGAMTKTEPLLRPMANGFAANCEFFKLEFLEKSTIAFGHAFNEILPLLWLKAGAKGVRPEIASSKPIPEILVMPNNNFAVLTDEDYFPAFKSKLAEQPMIKHVFLVTDSFKGFQEMALELPGRTTYQLYRDYLDNFRINIKNTTSR